MNAAIAFAAALLLFHYLSTREIPAASDDESYLLYVSISAELLAARLENFSLIEFFLGEPLWLFGNMALAWIYEPEDAMRAIIGLSFAISFISMFKLTKWNAFACLAFFLFPTVMKNYVVHIRQGTAISVLLLFLAFRPRWAVAGALLATLIHTSLIVLSLILIVDRNRWLRQAFSATPRSALVMA